MSLPPNAYFLMEANRYSEAIDAANAALEQNPEDADTRLTLCICLFLTGDLAETLRQLKRYAAFNPDNPTARWLLAGTLLKLYGELNPHVMDAYDNLLAIDPDNAHAQTERAGILRALGRTEEAKTVYQQFSTADNNDEILRLECLFNLGCVCMVLGQNDEARAAFQTVLDLAPDYPHAAMMLELTQE